MVTVYTVFDVMPRGQYVGELIGTVIEDDPKYMRWVLTEWDDFDLDDEGLRYLKAQE